MCFSAHSAPHINVLIAKSLKDFTIEGLDLKKTLLDEKVSRDYIGKKKLRFDCGKLQGFLKKKMRTRTLVASLSSPTGLVNFKNDPYKGEFNVLARKGHETCDLINSLPIDDYISLVLPKEMSSKWPIEALKAQAVAARTYALFMIQSKRTSRQKGHEAYYDLESSEKHQVSGHYFDQTLKTWKASHATKGIILSPSSGELVPAFYHAKCGGRTLLPSEVWDNKVAGYAKIVCPFCHKEGRGTWNYELTKRDLNKTLYSTLGRKVTNLAQLSLGSDRFQFTELNFQEGASKYSIPKSQFRRKLGRSKFRSNNYKLFQAGSRFIAYGEGNGHGVGLCQYGAKSLAEKGWDYKRILKYYYPKMEIVRAY